MADYFHATGGTGGGVYKLGGAVAYRPGLFTTLPHSDHRSVTTVDEYDHNSPAILPSRFPTVGSSGDVSFPTSGTGASVVYSAVPGLRHLINGVICSYNTTPTSGELTVSTASTVISRNFVTATGPTEIEFDSGLAGNINEAMTITLTSGGAAVTGRVQVLGHQTVS